jgi:hypothetical protein
MTNCRLTIIRATGRRLAKLIPLEGEPLGYDLAKTLDLIPHPVADLAALHRLLFYMLHRQDCAIIRADAIDRTRRVRRLLYDDPETGDAATLREAPRRWLAIDLDSLPAPDGLDLTDLAACGEAALTSLPTAFHGASYVVQATASHTIKTGLRLRLWFWLARPMLGAELKRWLSSAPVDTCVFTPAQPIYTAAPVFVGRPDPLPVRLAMQGGAACVQPPSAGALAPPPPRPMRPLEMNAKSAGKYAQRALENAVARILTAPGRHPAIVAEARNRSREGRSGRGRQNHKLGGLTPYRLNSGGSIRCPMT